MSKNNLLCSFLHAQTCSCVRNLYSCVNRLVLACVYLFFSLCMRRFHPVYACKILHTRDLSCARMVLGRNPNLGILAHFSSVCNFNVILHHFCTQFYALCHISSYCTSNITLSPFLSPNHEFNLTLFLYVSALYFGKGNTRWVLVWYSVLTKETQGHIHTMGFEPVNPLMPERFTSAILA